jgi:hypothetical protein
MNDARNGNHRPNRPRPGGSRPNGGSPNYRQRQMSGGGGGGQRHQNGNRPNSGSAQRNYERYISLAREASLSGDNVEMENCYQHAEHYLRVMKERAE